MRLPRFRPAAERLEARAVPARLTYGSGVLYVYGDAWSNVATVGAQSGTLTVNLTSYDPAGRQPAQRVVRSIGASQVQRIRFLGGDAPDRFVNNTAIRSYADGGNGNDRLDGGAGADTLYGGAGADTVVGNGGSDDLHGNAGADRLYGQAGNDGLYGGLDADYLFGSDGADRFLIMAGAAEARDPTAQDAVVRFRNGGLAWSEREIQWVDQGLTLLHARTGNARLLKQADGRPVTFIRHADEPGTTEPGTTYAINNGDGTIEMFDLGPSSLNTAQMTAVHELAHHFDEPAEAGAATYDRWLAQSGWTDARPAQSTSYYRSDDGAWWYLRGARFALAYGRTNPYEDWATAWESYFTYRHRLPDEQGEAPLPAGKTQALDAFFARLSG